ncbi:sensor histidine kinase [Marinoscillum furvescens]|uniref:histidine kinase n=1 Tax=Marinoscillum furvescens DSM 4134 TaxID=1122208 RepID=A0A3D9L252_MARFU|nr:HAMP domain-containing sensor histidine kinase [Marinoscillum furvescens]RED98819.1 two-component system phosphate regulon sensor histidine kinase PhoR [Marinoscillum furvescens DSM 4134]
MKNTPIRFLVVLGSLSMVAIVVVQVFWVSQAMDKQEEQFNRNVQMALHNVVEGLCEANGNDIPSIDPIDQLSSNYFIARTNYQIDLQSLDYLLRAELRKYHIDQDYEYGVYDCQSDRMVYGDFVRLKGADGAKPTGKLPKLAKDEYYFGLYFPGKASGLANQLGIWKVTSGLTLVILIFFSYALVVILRQKRLSEVQRDFINNMTHEFKTPLTTLQVAAGYVDRQAQEGSKMEKYAAVMRSELARLEQHVHRLLQTAQLEGERKEHVELIAIRELIERKLRDLPETPKNVESDINSLKDLQVSAPSILLETVLDNLLDNALKYGDTYVRIVGEQEGKHVRIRVINDGVGIPKKDQKKVFEKFYRIGNKDRHDVKGFGLGLYFVKTAIRKIGGRVSLVSNTEETEFCIKLPIA